MRETRPSELVDLLQAESASERETAWRIFLDRFSRVVLYAARKAGHDYDSAMDRYRFALEELRKDDFRRLRTYTADGRSSFENWLIIVTNRLCVDYHRREYGRVRGERSEERSRAAELRALRRRLRDFDVEPLDTSRTANVRAADPDETLRLHERNRALARAVRTLPVRDQLLLKLRFHDNRPVRRIASLLDYPSVFHVYRRIKKICSRLREELEERGFDDIRA